MQAKELYPSKQVPPFTQGLEEHSEERNKKKKSKNNKNIGRIRRDDKSKSNSKQIETVAV
jgi:hypothetical protein